MAARWICVRLRAARAAASSGSHGCSARNPSSAMSAARPASRGLLWSGLVMFVPSLDDHLQYHTGWCLDGTVPVEYGFVLYGTWIVRCRWAAPVEREGDLMTGLTRWVLRHKLIVTAFWL